MIDTLSFAYEEAVRTQVQAPADWKFFDSPMLSRAIWEDFLSPKLTPENCIIAIFSEELRPGCVRGTFFFSPELVKEILDAH